MYAFLLAILMTTTPVQQSTVDKITDVLVDRLTFPYSKKVGKPRQVGHCRHAPEGCRARLHAFAQHFVEQGERNGVDPWILAVMALAESGLNPYAVGAAQERGILQIHPRSKRAHLVPFIRDEKYREKCRKAIDACQGPVIAQAAEILASGLKQCGSMDGALRMYNAGDCDKETPYPRKVMKLLDRLRPSAS